MKYLKQDQVKDFREKHCQDECPLTRAVMDDVVVDHCHRTGLVRDVLHRQSNVLLGKIENAWKRYAQKSAQAELPDVLRNIADYLEEGCTDILHPYGATQLAKRFSAKKKSEQEKILLDMGVTPVDIEGLNSTNRAKMYRKTITKNKYES